MYHRLILAMNISILFQSSAEFWGTMAVPEGTPYYVGAKGTEETCRIQGFFTIMFSFTVPIYYASLSIYSFLAIKNQFKETRYRWIEKWIHAVAIIVPLLTATVMLVIDNIEPAGSGCYFGDEAVLLTYILGFGQLFVYFFIPATAMIMVWRLMKKTERDLESAQGLRHVMESARKSMLRDTVIQICRYLFSFWITYIFSVAQVLLNLSTGQMHYNLTILANILYLSQGFIMAVVYFQPQKISLRKVQVNPLPCEHLKNDAAGRLKKHQTVVDIRANAEASSSKGSDKSLSDDVVERPIRFSIFDGTPDDDSPWAMYFDTIDGDGTEETRADSGAMNEDSNV